MDRVLRFWTCDLTGDECATILRNGEEICVTAAEGYEIWTNQNSFVIK